MINVANRIYVTQEYAEAFEQRFRERGRVGRPNAWFYFKPDSALGKRKVILRWVFTRGGPGLQSP